ncbi:hypothetical protein OTK49_20730 [Vibrio coralliirubri]|uniref:YVTN family beta-propeller repeat protein n=1 Tax=Vibrio coralliirubri TaxID=1516159 RepID=UPI0022835923|nr:cytochrome D1 domain-containing protein [Vibrio coralliirubri]MCY9864944.1 hypothetical protein [Vibrio coralliirubri]
MKNKHGVLTACVALALGVSAFATNATAADIRTKYSHLTSSVWRYGAEFKKEDLTPVVSDLKTVDVERVKPLSVELSADSKKLYVTMQGTENLPLNKVAVMDAKTGKIIKVIEVGLRPFKVALHPNKRHLVVTNEFSNYMSVIDTKTDKVTADIPLDFYAQDIEFSDDGKRAWVAVRYLDQVLVVDFDETGDKLMGKVTPVGGFDEAAFYGTNEISNDIAKEFAKRGISKESIANKSFGGINGILRSECSSCHTRPVGGFMSGDSPEKNFLSAVENSVGGKPEESVLLRAVTPKSMGGFGDENVTLEFHAGGALFKEGDPELIKIQNWIKDGFGGPGIIVGNEQAHPRNLTRYGKYLLVGNTGTMDVGVIDTEANKLVSGLFVQNVAIDLATYGDHVIVASMGSGFGAPKARDPLGGESHDRGSPATQYTVLRDAKNGYDAFPIDQQFTMGQFDAIDGTWNFKMRDIQNDLVMIKLDELNLEPEKLGYAVLANKYEAHNEWVRYTSDTAEATFGDIKGDIPPELQRVYGAMPNFMEVVGDKLYVSMRSTFNVVEWQINSDAKDPSNRLEPLRSFDTGMYPADLKIGNGKIYVANEMSDSVTIIDLKDGNSKSVALGDITKPAPYNDIERGDLIVHSTVFSSDGDTSCSHCHYQDTGDGRGWGAAEAVGQNSRGHLTSGGTLGIPQMKNIGKLEPFYFEGTHTLAEGQGADVNEQASSIDFDRPIWSGDYSHYKSPVPQSERRLMHEELKERVEINKLGDAWYDFEYRRNEFLRDQAKKHLGGDFALKDYYQFVGAWMGEENRLLPNPFDNQHPSVKRGEMLFNSAEVMCSACHTQPQFTNKEMILTNNDRRALPQLTTMTRRDASYSLASVFAMENVNGNPTGIVHPDDAGRFEDVEGSFTTMTLRNIFNRPPVFLHHGRARSIREVVLSPQHPAARSYLMPIYQGDELVRANNVEIGFNELTERKEDGSLNSQTRVFDSHGGTSHLNTRQVNDLVNFLKGIE